MKPRILLVALVALVCTAAVAVVGTAGAHIRRDGPRGSYEVWLIDQEDRYEAGARDAAHLRRRASWPMTPRTAVPESIDLARRGRELLPGAHRQRCRCGPHMLVFNGGDDDGPSAEPLRGDRVRGERARGVPRTRTSASRSSCIDVGTQAHAAWPTPDQRHLIVANQNGKKLPADRHRLPRASGSRSRMPPPSTSPSCTTPSGAPCQDPELRPGQRADLPAHDERRRLHLRDAARRRHVRGRPQPHADADRGGVRPRHGRRQRLRRDGGRRAHVRQQRRRPDGPVGAGRRALRPRRLLVRARPLQHDPEHDAEPPRATHVYTRDEPGGDRSTRTRSRSRERGFLWWGDRDRERRDGGRPALEQRGLALRPRERVERRPGPRPVRPVARTATTCSRRCAARTRPRATRRSARLPASA